MEPFKETGVKRIMLIAVAPVKETTLNLQVIFDKLQFSMWQFDYRISADFSCVNKLLGLGNHKSLFCCYICEWHQRGNGGKTRGARKRTVRSIAGEKD